MEITRLDDRVSVSPQIVADDLAAIAARGFRVVVNNRPDGEAPGQPSSGDLECEAVRRGLHYFHLPITPGEMTEHHVQDFAQILSGTDGPVLAFCRSGARSTRLWEQARALVGRTD